MAQDGPKLNFTGLNSGLAARWQAGVPDANSHPPERHVTTAGTGPCRHCLGEIAGRETYLILAHRPFPKPQPSAEVGPIFLCAAPCARYDAPAAYRRLKSDRALGYARFTCASVRDGDGPWKSNAIATAFGPA